MKPRKIITGADVKPETLKNKKDLYSFFADLNDLNTQSWAEIEGFASKWGVNYDQWLYDRSNPKLVLQQFTLIKQNYLALIQRVTFKQDFYLTQPELLDLNKALSTVSLKISSLSEQPDVTNFNDLYCYYQNGQLNTEFYNQKMIGHPDETKAAKLTFLMRPKDLRDQIGKAAIERKATKLDEKLIKIILRGKEFQTEEYRNKWVIEKREPGLDPNSTKITVRIGKKNESLKEPHKDELFASYRVTPTLETVIARKIWQYISSNNPNINLCIVCGRPISRPNSSHCSREECRNIIRAGRNKQLQK